MAAQLSAEEAAVYDRQIRLWGVDAQARMQSSRVVLAGRVDGALAEIAKNLVLAGVKLTLSDDTPVQEADLCTNFFLRAADVGRPTAEACAPRMRELNPLSAVDVLDTPLASADDAALASALASATVLVLGGPPSSSKDRLSDAARAAGVAVVQVHVCGPFSLAWLDWGASYTFSQESKAADPTAAAVKQGFSVSYPSCTEARALRPAAGRKVRRAADKFAVLCCMWALEVEALRGSSPGEADLSATAAALATACGLPSDTASPAVAAEVVRCRGTQDPSTCALVGGLLAVEVTKVLQRKGMPAFHLVVFDGRSGESRAVDLTSPLARYDPPFVKDAGSSTADQAPSGAEPDGGAEVLDDDDVVLEGIGGFSIASWRSIKALLQQERDAAQKSNMSPDESAHAWSPDVMLQFWVTSGLLHYLATLHLPYAAELRTLLLLVCIAPGLGITASTSIYQHATKPLVDAVAPTVVPRVLRLKRSSQKAAVAALQPMLTMATESLLPYAAPEDLDRAQEAMERLRAQVTKRRRELEIRGLARPLMGSPTASVLGQAAANVMESVQGAVQADDQAPPPSSDRSSMEAAAQGAWSMVSGLVRMLPAAQGATSPRHSSAAGTVASATSGGSGASGVVSEDAQRTWEAGLEDMDAVLDDDQVPLAFVDEDSSPPPVRGRHTMAGPGAAKGQRQPRTRASDGYTMRKRSGGTRGAMH